MYSWQQFSLCGLPFHSPNCLVTQKVFNFMRSFWSIIGFSFWANGALFRKFFSTLVSCGRVLMFVFFYQCHCLDFTFGSLIHLELIFMQSDSYWPNFILLHVDIRFSQQHLLKMLPPTHTHTLFWGHLCQIFNGWIYGCSCWVFSFVPLIDLSVFVPVLYCSHYSASVIYFKVRSGNPSSIVLFVCLLVYLFVSQNCFGYLGSFVVPYEFLDCFFHFWMRLGVGL